MHKATLRIADPKRREPLRYAARLLLDSARVTLRLECADGGRDNAGLEVPGGLVVPATELEEIFAAATLSREITCRKLDSMGMFDEAAVAWDVSRPWIDLRGAEIARQFEGAPRAGGSPPRPFRVIISHDVDRTTGREPTALVKSILRAFRLYRNWMPLGKVLSPKAWLRNYRRILDCERQHGVGAYYFMLAGPYGLRRYSSRCDVRWGQSREVLEMIRAAGMTVGLHGSYYAREEGLYRQEKERLEAVLGSRVRCHRNHYLRFDPAKVWSQLEAAGIDYDFSIGFNYRLGFRAGCARAYRAFDLLHGRPSGVLSIPLLFMDGILLGGNRREILRQLRAGLEDARQVGGCLSLLFHPELFLIDPGLFDVFEDTLRTCEELGADLSGQLPALADDHLRG